MLIFFFLSCFGVPLLPRSFSRYTWLFCTYVHIWLQKYCSGVCVKSCLFWGQICQLMFSFLFCPITILGFLSINYRASQGAYCGNHAYLSRFSSSVKSNQTFFLLFLPFFSYLCLFLFIYP